MSVRVLQAEGEADGVLAWLGHERLVSAVITDDTEQVGYLTPTILFQYNPDGPCKCLTTENLQKAPLFCTAKAKTKKRGDRVRAPLSPSQVCVQWSELQ